MKTIVALVDFTDASSKVLKHAHMLTSAFGSRLILMHIVPLEVPVAVYGAEVAPVPVEPTPSTVVASQTKLDELLQAVTRLGVNATALQFTGPVAETVLAETGRLNADLVIMGSHHHNALYHLFIGSTTNDVLKRAPFPVLVVPCDMAES
ncbi:MAG: hypothetical protein B7Z47_00890 [Chthoniobacter sp. 12-60-6]|nr:MAG: hypothetical protein B7Z47_00890 [Chthoniobacter sp. 12-60-6]